MATLTVPVKDSANLKANRLLAIASSADGSPYLTYAEDSFPRFRSESELKKGTEVTITIKLNDVWEIEAGEDIKINDGIYGGEEGKAYPHEDKSTDPSFLFGYSIDDGKKGDLVRIVRNQQINGNWVKEIGELEGGVDGKDGSKGPKGDTGPDGADGKDGAKGPKGDTGPAGKDATEQFTAGEVTALKALLEE